MIKAWKKQIPIEMHEEFDLLFKEFESIPQELKGSQQGINVFMLNQLIAIRFKLRQLNKASDNDKWKMERFCQKGNN